MLATEAAVTGITPKSLGFLFIMSTDVGIEVILAPRG